MSKGLLAKEFINSAIVGNLKRFYVRERSFVQVNVVGVSIEGAARDKKCPRQLRSRCEFEVGRISFRIQLQVARAHFDSPAIVATNRMRREYSHWNAVAANV